MPRAETHTKKWGKPENLVYFNKFPRGLIGKTF